MNKPVVMNLYRIGVLFENGRVVLHDLETKAVWGPWPALTFFMLYQAGGLAQLIPTLPKTARLRETVLVFESPA